MKFELHHGDCLDVLKTLADCSVDAIVTDPPYGLSFMGKRWDYDVPTEAVWVECLRVLKPGGHLLAFAGTRTQHRMAVRIEDAGFEIRDMIAWVYGSGFPKSLDVSKAIDKAAGVKFDAVPASGVGFMNAEGEGGYNVTKNQLIRKGDSTPEAKQWEGWGTALKPAVEPVGVYHKGLTLENVFGILMASLTQELWRSICQWSNASASDAENLLSGIRARLEKAEAFSVVESARTFALGSIESAILAASSSISPKLTETARDTTKGGSAQEGANPSGRKLDMQGTETQAGRVDVMSLVDMFICATTEHTGQNIALLWSGILGETLNQANTFTIATALRLTTALKTLRCLMQANTLQSTGSLESCSPALEPITLARKPPIGTIAANVLEHGTGGLNIDGCRIEAPEGLTSGGAQTRMPQPEDWGTTSKTIRSEPNSLGRFPANFIHDNSEQVLALFPEVTCGTTKSYHHQGGKTRGIYGAMDGIETDRGYGDTGSAARFFYCAKASRDDRDEGLPIDQHSSHPTVKPTDLMRYLCRLITPPGGIVLDPFTGSGSTGKAAMAEGFRFIGIEREAEYIEIARARISAEAEKPRQLSLF
jgi:16S rRNA G966 N2-methylase RsmD